MAETQLPSVDTRISHSGHLGTIRFVGAVEHTSGTWLGVEWDDPSRGKHDGTKEGRRYFSCLQPHAGSFIRPTASGLSYGTSFLAALAAKYVDIPRGSDELEKVVLGSSHGAIEVEAVNLDKIRGKLANLDSLREVSLDNEGVSCADLPGAIMRTCPGIRGLDLSKNLIPSWDVVAKIVVELSSLQRLALNQNRLAPPHDTELATRAFKNLRELQLSSTLTTWREMNQVINYMPSLRALEMGYNNLKEMESGPSTPVIRHPALELLNLDSNAIASWPDMGKTLHRYPALQRVVLTSNQIATIPTPETKEESSIAHIKHISLSFNKVATWRDIDNLPLWCPAVESLTLTGNTLTEHPVLGKNARQFAIAKIPSLLVLDGATVTPKERTDCELFYMSHILNFGPADEDARSREHPRWSSLCQKHGKPDDATATRKQKQQDTLSNRLIQINVHKSTTPLTDKRIDSTLWNTHPPTELSVLSTMPLRAFRMKVIKALKLPRPQHASLRLWLLLGHGQAVELERKHDTSDLAWWGIEDGSMVVVYAE